jgi:hypothetical protein
MKKDPNQTLLEIANHIVSNHSDLKHSFATLVATIIPDKDPFAGADIDRMFPMFSPKSGGNPTDRTRATLDAINFSFPLLGKLVERITGKSLPMHELESSFVDPRQVQRSRELEIYFNHFGSDKAATHAYHHFYANAFNEQAEVRRILEVGLGTNNLDVLSTMGPQGSPGASLRAFRAFFPLASLHGCDVDTRILFTEDRITTSHIDQTLPETFESLVSQESFDLLIDDGLHSPHANINTLDFFLTKLAIGGWAVIEDIGLEARPIWSIVNAILSDNFTAKLFKSRHTNSMLFAVNRIH